MAGVSVSAASVACHVPNETCRLPPPLSTVSASSSQANSSNSLELIEGFVAVVPPPPGGWRGAGFFFLSGIWPKAAAGTSATSSKAANATCQTPTPRHARDKVVPTDRTNFHHDDRQASIRPG